MKIVSRREIVVTEKEDREKNVSTIDREVEGECGLGKKCLVCVFSLHIMSCALRKCVNCCVQSKGHR